MIRRKDSGLGIRDVDSKKSIIVGYASAFGSLDSHGDIVMKGAFKRTLGHNANRVKSLLHHDPVQIVGKPMKMSEDEHGLYTETKISDTALGRDLLTLVADGVIDEMSIGFMPVREEYDKETKANLIHEVKLVEYSFVTLASNADARIQGLKGTAAVNEVVASMRRFEKALRDGSFVTDEVPEAMEFIVRYWRSVIESTKSELVDPPEQSIVDSLDKGTPRDEATSAEATLPDLSDVLRKWEFNFEILSAMRSFGGLTRGK
jgi:HK97 family phage prohead protease